MGCARLVPVGFLSFLPGCLTPLLWEDHGKQTWRVEVHAEDLEVTRTAVVGERLLLGYRVPRPLPSPWSGELGPAGWLELTPLGGGAALALLRGREDLKVDRAMVGLVANRPDSLGIGPHAEVFLEGSLRSSEVRRLAAAEIEKALAAAAAVDFDPPPALSSCIQAVDRTPAWVLTAVAECDRRVHGTFLVNGWVGEDLLPMPPERAGLSQSASEPLRHTGALSRIHLLLKGWDATGEAVYLLLPADLAFLLQHVEVRVHPVPHFVHRSRWQPSTPTRVPEDLVPSRLRVTLTATTRVREQVSSGGFWDTIWRVLLTPITAAADAALGLGLGAAVLAAEYDGGC